MRLLIAGGGTGGHLFPALAVARAVKVEDPAAGILFVGTLHGIEAKIVPGSDYPIRFISARGMRKTGIFNAIRASLELPLGVCQSVRIIRSFRPDVVLGVGGYASGPTLSAAVLMRVPTAIQEQNSVMGTTNRILARFVDRIFISWQNTDPPTRPEKTMLTGNPVREDIFETVSQERARDGFNILIFGGSRGARSINQALAANLDMLAPLAGRVRVLHQTGQGTADEVKSAYDKAGIEADVREFIDNMGPTYQWADVVVCRSGASSLAEITALGKPAIVVPYPYAIGDHQMRNAQVLESEGAVRIIRDEDLKNGALVKEIRTVLGHPDMLSEMARKSRTFGRPDAARAIARELLKLGRSPR
jgi:UDP-N-acetylglucosamine--N-acetylmuramyl-(pentapeptide) pyrophosphoryl-undecaprenol N-acetylglucosamine transferase